MIIEFTSREKDILYLALVKLEQYYDDQEVECMSNEYTSNDNQNEDILGIKKSKEEARQLIMKILTQ